MMCTRLLVVCGSILSLAACIQPGDTDTETKPFSGLNGTLTQIASAATLDECPNGGVTLEHGIDTDGDGRLSEKEVTNTYVICHGKDGADGSDAEVSVLQAELDALKAAVAENTSGVSANSAAVEINTAKVGVSNELLVEVALNTAKTGISAEQSAAIVANTQKVGVNNELVGAIALNTAKVGISPIQVNGIEANTAKVSFPGFGTTAGTALEGNFVEADPVASAAGYLTTETDPVFSAHAAFTISTGNITNWDTSLGWGDHSGIVAGNTAAIAALDFTPFACAAGYAGAGCVYSDLVTCNGNGSVASDGSCACDSNWSGDACDIVNPGPEGMVEVPAGDFVYGDSNNTQYLDTFLIDQYPVTAGDYKACVDSGSCVYDGSTSSSDRTYDNDKDDHPINYVNYDEASTYCAWKGKRLPTEYEWEKAARGTDGRTYPWGEDSPDGTRSNYLDSGDAFDNGTTPVGYYDGQNGTLDSPSPYGAYDMAGNVWDWTASWDDDDSRVVRGGSFLNDASYLESSPRYSTDPDYRYGSSGFRCAQ